MTYISQPIGYLILVTFGAAMLVVTYTFGRWGKWRSRDGFLVANREVGWVLGGISIAASWIWAPALFVSVQTAYQMGIAGIFWFTLPNVLSLVIFAFLAPKIREKLPSGYTLPQFVQSRLRSNRVHKLYLFPYVFYQIMAVVVQLFAGGSLVSLLTGIALPKVMVILSIVVLSYTLVSGLEASIVTDFVQLATILLVIAIIVPFAIRVSGGYHTISTGLGGLAGVRNILDPGVAFSFGVVTSIGLIAGSISDQSNWQRAFAIKKGQLVKAFLFGAAVFGIVPVALSVLGFIAASPSTGITLPRGTDPSMIGVQTIAHLLPVWAVFFFAVAFLAILSSSLDAGLCAGSSLWVTDVSRPRDDAAAVRSARMAMIGFTLVGLGMAMGVLYIPHFGLEQLWWVFNTIAACVMVPTVLTLYWDRVSERGVFWGVLTAFVLGVPLFIYSNIVNKPAWTVGSSLFIVCVSTLLAVLVRRPTEKGRATAAGVVADHD